MLLKAVVQLFGKQVPLRLLASSASNHVHEVAVHLVSRPSAVKSLVTALRSTLQRTIDGGIRQSGFKIQAGNLQFSGHIPKNSLLVQHGAEYRVGHFVKWSVYFNSFQRVFMSTRASAFSSALRGRNRLGIVSFALLGFTLVESDRDANLKPSVGDLLELYKSKFASESKVHLSTIFWLVEATSNRI